MKWSVLGLLVLGLIASLCAAFLVATLSGGGGLRAKASQPFEDRDIDVLVASRNLPASTVVDANNVSIQKQPMSKVPGALSSPVEVVGKVLAIPMKQGQPFTRKHFASEGTGTQLAAYVDPGKRAVAISVTNYAALEGVLYPGSIVDVLAAFRGSGSAGTSDYREALSTTLLERVQVLAIERNTVVSSDQPKEDSDSSANRSNSTRRITLLVDLEQAKALQLAQEQGILSLALRNPLDTARSGREVVALSHVLGGFYDNRATPLPAPPKADKADEKPAVAPPPRRPTWETTILRGGTVEMRQFPLPSEEGM